MFLEKLSNFMNTIGIAFILGSLGGIVRYLFQILQGEKFKWKTILLTTLIAGMIGILAFFFAPLATDSIHVQYGIMYISGIISREIMKIIVEKGPNFINKKIDDES